MKTLHNLVSRLNTRLKLALGAVCAFFMFALTIVVLWGVGARYFFGSQPAFTEEFARMFLIVLTFLGGALAFSTGSHIGLDFISARFSFAGRKFCALIALSITMFFVCSILIFGGVMFVETSYESANQLVSVPVGAWVIYVSIPVSGVLALSFLIEAFLAELLKSSSGEAVCLESEGGVK